MAEVTRNQSAPFAAPVSSQLTRPLSNTPRPWRHLTLLPSSAALVRVRCQRESRCAQWQSLSVAFLPGACRRGGC